MKSNKASARLSVVGKLPEGYVILCRLNGDEYSFLTRTLGISVECPHCGATRHGVELAQEYFLGNDIATRSSLDDALASHGAQTETRRWSGDLTPGRVEAPPVSATSKTAQL
jgi:hypothetical protein